MNLFAEILASFTPEKSGFVFMWILAGVALAAVVLMIDRWWDIRRRTDVDAEAFSQKIKKLIDENNYDEAFRICSAAGRRALPRIIGAGVKKAKEMPQMIRTAMEEESLHMLPLLEKRVDFLMMIGNVSTLLGLMGTIYGLILSFAAVARPDVSAVEKSSLLAAGISAAMNTTLMGLFISVPCILIYSLLRSKIDFATKEIDRFAVSVLKALLPSEYVQKGYRVTGKRYKEEVDTEPNIAPMMNLMVILIPMLLTSAEFVKIGAIELKLPKKSSAGTDTRASGEQQEKQPELSLGVAITAKGFTLFHYFKNEDSSGTGEEREKKKPDIQMRDGEYDFAALNEALAKVKRSVLFEIISSSHPEVQSDATLLQLYTAYTRKTFSGSKLFADHENIKIVAEEKVRYQTVVSVMDAARGVAFPQRKVTMFPNVSLAGGVIR
ncbi:MAG: hypothetical protein GF350_16060 [Chitinivibrionales bacterium]|nr:hypothetical protein [Chitinivibrionales bacterium]